MRLTENNPIDAHIERPVMSGILTIPPFVRPVAPSNPKVKSLTIKALAAVALLGPSVSTSPNYEWKGAHMHEALALACGRKEAKQLSLQFIPAPQEANVLLQSAADDSRNSHSSPILGLGNVLEVPTVKSDSSLFLDPLHLGGAPSSVTGSSSSLPTTASGNRKEPYISNISDLHGSAKSSDSGNVRLTTLGLADFGVGSSLPSPGAKGQADSKRLALDFLLGPKNSNLADRVCARLIQSEAHEQNPSLRSDYRQAFICVSLASKGNTEPFLSSSYAMYGIHPSKVWPRIVANRKERLGREYHDFYDSNDMPRPDIPSFRKPPVFDPQPNDRLSALLQLNPAGIAAESGAGNTDETNPIAPAPFPNSKKEHLA